MLVIFGGSVFRLPGSLDRLIPRIDVEGDGSVEAGDPETDQAAASEENER
jgi:hypothetical protein